jgi:predicted AAA+ superfamily ATPase
LSVLAGVIADEPGQLMLQLLEVLLSDVKAPTAAALYARLFALLIEEAELYRAPLVGDAWQHHLLDRLLSDENALSRKLSSAAGGQVGGSLLAQTRRDLARLQVLYRLDARALAEVLGPRSGTEASDEAWPAWDQVQPLDHSGARPAVGATLKRRLACLDDWREALSDLQAHYTSGASGVFGQFAAFRWAPQGAGGRLDGIAEPDPIRLDELIGYEAERELLIRNTEWFLRGLPANNVLVYGERGTGKSSTIKALLNAYAERGLRMVEVSKHDLASFPAILSQLRGRRERFILFVDDLSFEEHETHYKELKAILEGSLEARASNVLLYATSNRRHLVQERWSDREGFDHFDVHARDGMQEKLSLADRFGITLTFIAPDQERFLAIVEGLARSRGLAVAADELRRRAIQWAQWQNARSGRTARQFVDYLTAELAEDGF